MLTWVVLLVDIELGRDGDRVRMRIYLVPVLVHVRMRYDTRSEKDKPESLKIKIYWMNIILIKMKPCVKQWNE